MNSGSGRTVNRRGGNAGATPPRDTIIISHAVEDNEFTRWLALQLAACGYRVWCDLTKLLGGENFWADIEQVIRQRAVKFLYVLSRVSNSDELRGFRKELHIADTEAKRNGIPDFIIPLAVDDLSSSDYNVYLALRQAVDFRSGWSRGVFTLLQKLKKDRVPKRLRRFNPDAVTAWWQQYRSAAGGIRRKPDDYVSNWFPIQRMPTTLYFHELAEARAERPILDLDFPYPGFWNDNAFVTFVSAAGCEGRLGSTVTVSATEAVPVDCIISNSLVGHSIDASKGRYLLVRLLKEAWELWIEKNQAIGSFEMANHTRCSFFLKPPEGDTLKAWYLSLEGDRTWRGLTGFWSRTSKRTGKTRSRRWHFALDARPRLWPHLVYFVTSHVVFSDDGKTLWTSPRKMHRARRNQCKDWYNERWRDLLFAAMSYLAQESDHIALPVAAGESVIVSVQPTKFQSKLTFEVVKTNLEAFREAHALDEDEEEVEDVDPEGEDAGEEEEW
jgi:hypothetical protein